MTQPNETYSTPASEETLQRVAEKIRIRNIEVLIVNNAEEAKQIVLDRVPKGAEVYSGKSKTLQDSGIFDAIHTEDYDALRPKFFKMDRKTQMREIRKMISAPDYMLGSLNAITEDGILVATSATSSQLGPYASGAGKLILVVGSQKVVPDLDTAFKRIRDHALPWEDEQVRKVLPAGSFIGKTLIIEREWAAGRITVILVREPIGI
jgi:LUD domain